MGQEILGDDHTTKYSVAMKEDITGMVTLGP